MTKLFRTFAVLAAAALVLLGTIPAQATVYGYTASYHTSQWHRTAVLAVQLETNTFSGQVGVRADGSFRCENATPAPYACYGATGDIRVTIDGSTIWADAWYACGDEPASGSIPCDYPQQNVYTPYVPLACGTHQYGAELVATDVQTYDMEFSQHLMTPRYWLSRSC